MAILGPGFLVNGTQPRPGFQQEITAERPLENGGVSGLPSGRRGGHAPTSRSCED